MTVKTTKLNNMPCIISNDILVFDPNSGLKNYENTISGSFTYPAGDKPCSIMINKGIDVYSSACHAWLGFPETVIYRYKDGKFGIGKFKSTSEIPNRSNVLWAVGGLGLLDKYNPAEEGFKTGIKPDGTSYNYTDVLRTTSHTMLGIKDNQCYLILIPSMSGSQVNAYAKSCGFEMAQMLDGGHISSLNGSEAYAKINLNTKQGYAIQGINSAFANTTIPTTTPSPLIFKTNLTTVNFVKGRKSAIKYIVVHYDANDGATDENNGRYFSVIYRGASAHRFVDEDSVTMVVKDEDTAWHCNDTQKYATSGMTFKGLCNNDNSIGIEMCSDKVDGNFVITEATQKNTQELIRLLMAKHNIPIENVIRHHDVSGKICPEPFVKHTEQWVKFKNGITDKSLPSPILTGRIYKVQVGAFKLKTGAETLKAELIKAGYNSIIVIVDGLYKVQTGAFSNKDNALALQAKLKLLGYSTIIKEVL